MTNFKINFEYPWLLLLLIPALVLTLISYFKLKKRYRRTRNRIVSIVLHLVVMLLSITTLAGITFSYDLPNVENEILLLVDVSDSGENVEVKRNDYISDILSKSAGRYRVGVVTFGYDQVYAVPMDNESSAASLYSAYINAPLPDRSATNIAGALQYAKTLVKNPEAAKLVLISDGVETDGKALSVIKSLSADGLKVDTAYVGEEYSENAVEIVELTTPDYSLKAGVEFELGVTLNSSIDGVATLTLYDESATGLTVSDPVNIDLTAGKDKSYTLTHTIDFEGMHKIYVKVESYDDVLLNNNVYYSYINLELFDKVLIVERTRDEANTLFQLLETEYNVEVKNVGDLDSFPTTIEELRAYDQVVLMDIGQKDMPVGFEEALHSYVYDVGGGLLTVGGYAGDDDTHSYVREDMYGTLYQQMLPVQAINYTPPIGVMFIIDRSGSMGEKDKGTGKTYLDLAKEAVRSCLENPDVFSERDWCGIMTLETYYSEEAEIMPIPQYKNLVRAVDSIEVGGGTVFSGAIQQAGAALGALRGVERKHIIIVSDGLPSDSYDTYAAKIQECVDKDITLSIVTLGVSGSAADDMRKAATLGGGQFHNIYNVKELALKLTSELTQEEIKGINYEEFQPTIKNRTSVVAGIDEDAIPTLNGYYGTKIKEGAEIPLMGEYVPIYAQWKYGAGSVGSFMCDMSSAATSWSSNFVSNGTGIQLINNIIGSLFPTENIRVREIDTEIKEDNYTSQLSVFTTLEDNESIQVTVTNPLLEGQTEATKQVLTPSAEKGFSRVQFETKTAGVYELLIEKKAADGTTIAAEYTTYKAFSYSKEYNTFIDHKESKAMMQQLASDGDGTMLEDTSQIFAGFEKTLHREYDPRLPFIITVIVLFLLDIAVRKFKFKWLHEIIRDRKNKNAKKA